MAGRGRSSFGVLQVVIGVAVLLVVGIVLAFMFAPEKPPAPPTSKVTYDAVSPKQDKLAKAPSDFVPLPDLPGVRKKNAPEPEQKPDQTDEQKKDKPFKIIGVVVDARTKQPIVDALVTVRRQWTPDEQRSWEARNAQSRLGTDEGLARELRDERERLQQTERVRTKDGGTFELGLDQPGQYQCEAVHRQYMKQTADAGAVSAERPNAELQLALSNGATISGKVTEIGSPNPAPEVRVVIEKEGIHSATTDEKGNYSITGLSPGDYGVLVNTNGTAYKPGRNLPYQKVTIKSISDDLRNIDFEVEPAGVVWGYVRTPNNEPISGAEVFLTAPQSLFSQAITAAIRQAQPVRGTSQSDGYYELLGVPINEEWRVYATSKSASPQLAEPFMLTSQVRSVQIDVFLYGGSDVHGMVVNTKNQPVENADVVCMPSYTQMFSQMDAPPAFRNAKSGPDGSFTIEKLPAGEYQVLARKDDYKIPAQGVSIYPDGASPIDNVQVQLLPVDEGDHYVAGTVTDMRTREGISGAKVSLQGFGMDTMNNFTRDASTDSNGAFRIDGLEAGSYRVRVSKEGYAPRTIPRVLLDTETAIVLDQSAVIRGRVLVKETRKAPTVEYQVVAMPVNDAGGVDFLAGQLNRGENLSAFNNADGSYELYEAAGNYLVKATAADHTPAQQMVAVAAGQVVDNIDLIISLAGGSISGRVIAKGNESANGAEVTLVEEGAMDAMIAMQGPQKQRVGDNGEYTFNNLAEGQYYVIASRPSYANGRSKSVSLAAEQAATGIDIRLSSGGSIEGRVYHSGRPQVGAKVVAVSTESGSTGDGTTDANGAYTISDLGTGQYSVTWLPAEGGIGAIGNIAAQTTYVTEGQTSRVDFGLQGVKFAGRCVPAPRPLTASVALLQDPGSYAPPNLNIGNLSGIQFRYMVPLSITGGSFEFEGVAPGTYQLAIYGSGTSVVGGGQGGGRDENAAQLSGFIESINIDESTQPVTVQTSF